MIFRQFKDPVSHTFTYILAKERGAEALIIDPVVDEVDRYLKFLGKNQLRLVKAIDTHIHADHISALPKLRKILKCMTIIGNEANTDIVGMKVSDGDLVKIDGITLRAIYTPGHTVDSYCFYMRGMVFTGDTLMIKGTGRTDFQDGCSEAQYDSITQKLFKLPPSTMVFPAHDYKGETVSTIAIEKFENPRIARKTKEQFVKIMNELNLENPNMMDIAIPANLSFSEDLESNIKSEMVINPKQACEEFFGKENIFFVDLREEEEIQQTGYIIGSLKICYQSLEDILIDSKSEFNTKIKNGWEPVFYCNYGERSVLALEMVFELIKTNIYHIKDGIYGWIKVNGNKYIVKK